MSTITTINSGDQVSASRAVINTNFSNLNTDKSEAKTGADASKSAAAAGNLYLPNDGFYLRRDTGAAFANWGPIYPITEPDNSGFSDLNSPSAVSTTNGGIVLTVNGSATTNWRGRVKAIPSAPYTIRALISVDIDGANFAQAGIILYDGTKVMDLGVDQGGATHVGKWTNVTTFSAVYAATARRMLGPLIGLEITDNNTNRLLKTSSNGRTWTQAFSVIRTDFLTPTHYGFACNSENSDSVVLTLLSLEIT